jgi:maleate isomerase
MTYPYSTTGPIGTAARLGLIVLQADETIEHDFRRMFPVNGVSLLTTRVPSGLEVTNDTLSEMEGHLTDAASLFPTAAEFDAVAYACTSGTAVIGVDNIAAQVRRGCKTQKVTEPVSALIAACHELGISRLGLLSPYVRDVSESLRMVLDQAGIVTPAFGSFDEAEEAKVARIDGPSIIAAACDIAAQGGIDALFLSCTNLRTLDVISEIEGRTGLPVLSSNQVLAWHLAKLTDIRLAGHFGRLTA